MKLPESLILHCFSCTPETQAHLVERFPCVSSNRFVLFSLPLLLLLPRLTYRDRNNHVRSLVDLSPSPTKLNDKIYVLIGLFSRIILFCHLLVSKLPVVNCLQRKKRNQILFHQNITRRTTVMKTCKL